MTKTKQVISSTRLAKELLSNGYKIVDIAPHKQDSKRTVFIFENTNELQYYMKRREHDKTNTNHQKSNRSYQ